MACPDCFNNCAPQVTDQCVKYTGPDIEVLGICNGDPLSKVEEEIIDKLLSALDGTGITLEDITFANAPWLGGLFGTKNKNLENLFQLLIDSGQTLKSMIDGLKTTSTSFNTSCLEGVPSNANRDQVLQAALNTLCDVKNTVEMFPDVYVQASDLPSLVNNIITGGQSGASVNYKDRMVPYVVYDYVGPLSNFDSTGKGLVSTGFSRVFICNGLNNTVDYRGRVKVGAVKNVPGNTLDSAVNPNSTVNATIDVNYAVNQKFGENLHKLTPNENAPHTHSVVDPGHVHSILNSKDDANGGGKASVGNNSSEGNLATQASQTGITIGTSGGGVAHENRQPSVAVIPIIYLP